MKNPTTFNRLVIDELENQRSRAYATWRPLPSSATRRALALLDLPTPEGGKMSALHRLAVEERIMIAHASERGEITPIKPSWLEWLDKARQPWRFGVERHEWYFKGFGEQKNLAAELLKMRSNGAQLTQTARMLVAYYESIPDEELESALEWKSIRSRVFLEALGGGSDAVKLERSRGLTKETRYRICGFDSALELAVSFRAGSMGYSIYGFFDNPVASACYEGFFGLGIGEWDLLDEASIETAAEGFVDILAKHLQWKNQIR